MVTEDNKLTPENTIKLSWENKQGIKFVKEISLDNQFLFTVKQIVINSTNKKFDFYSYGQIIRNKILMVFQIFISYMKECWLHLMENYLKKITMILRDKNLVKMLTKDGLY